MQLVDKLRSKKPQLVKVCVTAGIHAAFYGAKAAGLCMRELIKLQGGNPDSQPGSVFLKALQNGFDYLHSQNLSSDMDHIWVKNRFKNVNSRFPDLTEDEYAKVTDLSKWDDPLPPPCEDFSTIEPASPLQVVAPDPCAPTTEPKRERERDEKIGKFLDEQAKARLAELEKILAEDGDVDVKPLVEKSKTLKEAVQVIKSGLVPTRRVDKFNGSFRRGSR